MIVGKRIGEGAGREEVYSLGCCLLTVSFGVGLVVSVCLAVLLPTVFIPYLYPLFLYHTCHTGQTDQCRNKEEHNREYFSDRTHTVRIFSESVIFCQCTSII